jgi:hypothetical protein
MELYGIATGASIYFHKWTEWLKQEFALVQLREVKACFSQYTSWLNHNYMSRIEHVPTIAMCRVK